MILTFGQFEIDEELYELRRDGVAVPIQRKIFDLLRHFARSRGEVVSREALLREVWPGVVVSPHALNQAVVSLRKAINDDAVAPRVLKTARGRGYRFDAEVREVERRVPHPLERDPRDRRALIGRGESLEHLDRALADVREGSLRLVVVLGEKGIGKSRLVEELLPRAGAHFTCIVGHGVTTSGSPPAWPWIEISRRVAASTDDTELLERDAIALGAELGAPEARFRFADRIVRSAATLAERRPLLLVLEDVSWTDEPTLDVLSFVARALARERVAIVVTATSDEATGTQALGKLLRLPGASSIELSRLSRSAVGTLLETLAARPASPAVLDRVFEKTAGVPALVVQVAHVVDAELPMAPGTSTMLGTSAVKSAIADQVQSLGERARATLQTAAAFGMSFALVPLAEVTASHRAELLDVLGSALTARVLLREDEGRYRFTQPLVRDALYRQLGEGERARLHARIGRALVAYYGAAASDHAGSLAEHFTEAAPLGGAEEAVGYALAALHAATMQRDRRAAEKYVALARRAARHAASAEASTLLARIDAAARTTGGDDAR